MDLACYIRDMCLAKFVQLILFWAFSFGFCVYKVCLNDDSRLSLSLSHLYPGSGVVLD